MPAFDSFAEQETLPVLCDDTQALHGNTVLLIHLLFCLKPLTLRTKG